jgi:C-terminal processing protease CtpA/Prc
MRKSAYLLAWVSCVLFFLPDGSSAGQAALTHFERENAEAILQQVHSEVAKRYYDDTFHGLDFNARYEEYRQKIDAVKTWAEAMRVIAAFLAGLNDSHTLFSPPLLVQREDYGYRLQMIGDRCYITEVRPQSDAEAKVHPGDEILSLNGYALGRQDLWQLWYSLNVLQPVSATKLKRRTPDGTIQEVSINATHILGKALRDYSLRMGDHDYVNGLLSFEQQTHFSRQKHAEIGDLMIWRVPAVSMDLEGINDMVSLARKHRALILDLRGSGGGTIDFLEPFVGSMIDHEVPIAQRIGRKPMKPVTSAKAGPTFTGDLIVLVDSRTASASEVFARTMQLSHRAKVIGDRTAGSVMESVYLPLSLGSNTMQLQFGVHITTADIVMPDGQRLEHTGVIPDELLVPSAADLAAGRDPILSHAAEQLGAKLSPKAAGELFPYEWPPVGTE